MSIALERDQAVPTRVGTGRRAAPALLWLRHLVIGLGALVLMFPLYWMVLTALRPAEEAYVYPPQWIPSALYPEQFLTAWTKLPFDVFLRNSVVITVLSLIGNVASSSIVAFGFARLRSRWRDPLFVVVLSMMMVPSHVTLIPTYALFAQLGWVNTLLPLIVPSFFGTPFYIFLLRQFFMTIPHEIDDAAKIDGCSPLDIFWRMIVPLSFPAMAAVAIFSFQTHWNDFLHPLIYLAEPRLFTMALGVRLFVFQHYTDYQGMMAVSALMTLPIMAVFLVAQKHFIRGVTLTGLKG
ncbi:MAG TPA: carbohydrate ABC transporter permease [Chloroflexota bacterium]|nr:carbohydrate ABC transporter permease [Chloroflexota bacterium]